MDTDNWSRMDTSSLVTSALSTSNSLLASSLSSGLMENKLLQSRSVSFKRQHSDNQAEPCKRLGSEPSPSASFQTGKNELSSNKLLQNSGGLSVNKCLSTSMLKTSSLSSAMTGLSTSSALLSTKSATPEATSKSFGTALSRPSLLQKEEPRKEENLSVQSSFPAYPELTVEGESLKSKAKRFCSDLEQKNNILPLEAKKVKSEFLKNNSYNL